MRSLYLVAAVLASWAPLALAQTVSGVITGTVKDQTDAVVVGASLDLINEATGARRAAVTNEVGLYTFSSVQPGSCEKSYLAQPKWCPDDRPKEKLRARPTSKASDHDTHRPEMPRGGRP